MERIEAHFNEENARFKAMMSQDHDLIGRVLKCHLVVEHYVERYLRDRFGLEELGVARLTFVQKASLLPSLKSTAAFVKPGILRLNAVRNRFGHTLAPDFDTQDLSPIDQVVTVSRPHLKGAPPIDRIEAFTAIVAAWLVVPPKDLEELFMNAFKKVAVRDA
jgi:hypothetical protein